MAYIGNNIQTQGFAPAIDYFSGNGVTVTYTLSRPVSSAAQMIVTVDNVIQNPASAYTVSGNSITFTSAPLSGTNNIWVEYTSLITTYAAISQSPSVIGDITASGGFLSTGAFGNSFVDGTIVDYVTGNGRVTVGPADGFTIYTGGTSARAALATWDQNGNMGLGTTSPTDKLNVFTPSTGTTAGSNVVARFSSNGSGYDANIAMGDNVNASTRIGYLSGAQYFWTNGAERMRLDTSGNVGIGTTTMNGRLSVYNSTAGASSIAITDGTLGVNYGALIKGYGVGGTGGFAEIGVLDNAVYSKAITVAQQANSIAFNTGYSGSSSNAERMRIDVSGNLLVGITSTGSAATRMTMQYGSATSWQVGPSLGNGNGGFFYVINASNTGVVLNSGNTSWSTNSDERLKTDLKPIENAIDKVTTLRSVTGRYKTDDEDVSRSFLIAQDVEQVFPEAVSTITVPTENGPEEYLGVQYTEVIPLLVASIKELKAEIDALKAGK